MSDKDIRLFIPLGRNHAISCRRLAEKMGISERDVQAAVLQARSEGYPICSTPSDGYYMPVSVEEALAYFYAQSKRLRSGNIALNAVRRYVSQEATRDQWNELERIERELSGNEKTAYGAGTTTDGIRD
ncbi:MAG: HTH domain-containing protein [Ruminiclostridium sp.]|nr:HTH domain-containing protein [Ruminiclostridium sp.]